MRRLTLTLLYFSLSLLTLSTYLQAYNPVDRFTINCGSSGNSSDGERIWTGDTNSKLLSPQHIPTTVTASANTQAPSINQIPFATARLSRSQFNYSFPVTTGPKFVRLFFYPASYQGGFDRRDASFTVESNGFTLLKDFNSSLNADAEGLDTIFREYTINVNDGHRLDLTLTPTKNSSYAFINGIEILSMPSDLYYTAPTDAGFMLVNKESTLYSAVTSTSLETSYRVKIGGQRISPSKDTGLFRNWQGHDESYLTPSTQDSLPGDTTGEMKVTVNPDYAAPEELYRTARDMGSNGALNKKLNLTWEFPVDSGFTYMIRLHFCELDDHITSSGDRAFYIYVAGKVAEERADVMAWTNNQRGIAVYRNYAVLIPENDGNQKKVNLSIQMHPYTYGQDTKYSDPFLNGVEIFKISDVATKNLAGRPNPDPVPSPQVLSTGKKSDNSTPVIGRRHSFLTMLMVAIASSAALIALLMILRCCFTRPPASIFFWKGKNPTEKKIEMFLKMHELHITKRYTYSEIREMTNFFKDKLGKGGFGSVYKGKLPDGRLVAVKVLNKLKGNGEDFINEVASISQTSHVNVVSLYGFCFQGAKRALVYEYMPNGSLEKFIYEHSASTADRQLDCKTLHDIAIGSARGLEYLHRGCNTRILHFDIKPHNILLDRDFCPKIADFGLAKICPSKESIVSMIGTRGTPGYIAPEVFSRNFGGVSHKSDVYSFGMMVLEMVGGRKNINVEVECSSEIYFPHWIYKSLEKNEELALRCIKNESDNEMVRKMILVSLWCIQTYPSARPAMSQVVDMLEGSIESLQVPPKPFLYSPKASPAHHSTSNLDSVSVTVN